MRRSVPAAFCLGLISCALIGSTKPATAADAATADEQKSIDLVVKAGGKAAIDPKLPDAKKKAFILLINALTALRRENKEILWSSMIKDTMKRIRPSFNETYFGYRSFSDLLEDAEKLKMLELETDKKSGTYVVSRWGSELRAGAPAPAKKPPAPPK